MTLKCPKCQKTVPEDSTYCPYCAYGLKPSARTLRVFVGSVLLIIAALGSLILIILSTQALLGIYSWYPQLTAQAWFIYDQMFAVFAILGLMFAVPATVLSLSRRSHKWTMISAVLCTLSGAGLWFTSMLAPIVVLWESVLYLCLPLFLAPFFATLLIHPRKAEFRS
jgi:hypothetical protein